MTIRPHRDATMSPMAAWMQWKVPVRLTAKVRDQSSMVRSSNATNPDTAALVTRIAIGPSEFRTCSNAASTALRSATSTATATAFAPESRSEAASRLRRLTVDVEHPYQADACRDRCRQMARPRPDAPPVTTATRSKVFLSDPFRCSYPSRHYQYKCIVFELGMYKESRRCNEEAL